MSIDWAMVREAQRSGDPERLASAGPVALAAGLQLVGELGPYVVGERLVRQRLRAALLLSRRASWHHQRTTVA